jgi:hypothetical protein
VQQIYLPTYLIAFLLVARLIPLSAIRSLIGKESQIRHGLGEEDVTHTIFNRKASLTKCGSPQMVVSMARVGG